MAAAGNDGTRALSFPARIPAVLAVGAMENNSDARAEFSSYGPGTDVVATGVEVVIGLADGVELARFVSSREETRFGKGGVIVTVSDMVAGARRVLVAEIAVEAKGAEKFLARIADVDVRAKSGARLSSSQ